MFLSSQQSQWSVLCFQSAEGNGVSGDLLREKLAEVGKVVWKVRTFGQKCRRNLFSPPPISLATCFTTDCTCFNFPNYYKCHSDKDQQILPDRTSIFAPCWVEPAARPSLVGRAHKKRGIIRHIKPHWVLTLCLKTAAAQHKQQSW